MDKEDLLNFYYKNKFNHNDYILNSEEYKEIVILTSFLRNDVKMIQRIWHLENDVFYVPKCCICGQETSFNIKSKRYNTTCCKNCKSEYYKTVRLKKIEKTSIEKYGVSNPMQNDLIKEKLKQTFIEKYEVENPSQVKEFLEKSNQTHIEKYGSKRYNQTEEGKLKQRQLFFQKYGVFNPMNLQSSKDSLIKTNLRLYGKEYYQQTEEGKERISKTQKQKSNKFWEQKRQKSIETNQIKYGVDYYMYTDEYTKERQHINLQNFKEKLIKDGYYDIGYRIIKNIGNGDYQLYCPICKQKFIINRSHVYYKRSIKNYNICVNCNPLKKQYSFMEKQLLDYIKIIYKGKISENNRLVISPYELDIYLPELKLAIEFNGDYWHANPKIYLEENKRISKIRYKDNLKSEICRDNNISLIIIWEKDWIERRLIVERYIRMIINIYQHNKKESA